MVLEHLLELGQVLSIEAGWWWRWLLRLRWRSHRLGRGGGRGGLPFIFTFLWSHDEERDKLGDLFRELGLHIEKLDSFTYFSYFFVVLFC